MEYNTKINIHWEKTNPFGRKFRIYSNGNEIGLLRRKSIFSAKAEGEIKGKKFSFLSCGIINKTLTISSHVGSKNDGSIELIWVGANNGVLKLNSGKSFNWKCIDLFKGRWGWLDNSNNNIMTFKPENLTNSKGSILKNQEENLNSDEDLLILLGLHLKLFFNYWSLIGVVMIFRG